jgi:hypothetical protein
MATPQVSEIFQEFNRVSDRQEKKNVLLKYRNVKALQFTIRAGMHPRIQFKFKEIPEYKSVGEVPVGMGYVTVASEIRKLYLFEEGNPRAPANLSESKRGKLLMGILEGMDRIEAEVFKGIILKNLPIAGLSKEMVEEVWPGLLTAAIWS